MTKKNRGTTSTRFTDREESRIRNIKRNCQENPKVESLEFYDIEESRTKCAIYQQTVEYRNGEVDFGIYLDVSLFDDLPASTHDAETEERICKVFNDVVEGTADYMGYYSSFRQRGRRDPYVAVYGRIHRECEDKIRIINEMESVSAVIRTSENMSPAPIYRFSETQKYLPEDYILVLEIETDRSDFDNISDDRLQEVDKIIDDIESKFDSVVFDWVGRVPFHNDFSTIGIGISI